MKAKTGTALALLFGLGVATAAPAQDREGQLLLAPGVGPGGQEYMLILRPREADPEQGARERTRAERGMARGDERAMMRGEAEDAFRMGYREGRMEAMREASQRLDRFTGEEAGTGRWYDRGSFDERRAGELGAQAYDRGRRMGRFEEQLSRIEGDQRMADEVRAALAEARGAMAEGDMDAAEQALSEAETVVEARRGPQETLVGALDAVEQALEEGDAGAARQAIRSARRAAAAERRGMMEGDYAAASDEGPARDALGGDGAGVGAMSPDQARRMMRNMQPMQMRRMMEGMSRQEMRELMGNLTPEQMRGMMEAMPNERMRDMMRGATGEEGDRAADPMMEREGGPMSELRETVPAGAGEGGPSPDAGPQDDVQATPDEAEDAAGEESN
jgi:hypothetical protein